jgi:hypothetical protein
VSFSLTEKKMPEAAEMFQRPFPCLFKPFRFSKFGMLKFQLFEPSPTERYLIADLNIKQYKVLSGNRSYNSTLLKSLPGSCRTKPFISRSKSVARTSEEFKAVFSTRSSIGAARRNSAEMLGVPAQSARHGPVWATLRSRRRRWLPLSAL